MCIMTIYFYDLFNGANSNADHMTSINDLQVDVFKRK